MGNLGNPILVYAERQSTLEEVLKYNMEAFVYLVCSVDKEEDDRTKEDLQRLTYQTLARAALAKAENRE